MLEGFDRKNSLEEAEGEEVWGTREAKLASSHGGGSYGRRVRCDLDFLVTLVQQEKVILKGKFYVKFVEYI